MMRSVVSIALVVSAVAAMEPLKGGNCVFYIATKMILRLQMANKLTPRMARLEFKWFQEMITKRKQWLSKTWKRPRAITTTVDMAMVVMAMVITVMVIVMDMDMDMDMDMAIITMEDTITMAMVATAATMGDMDTMVVMAMEVTTRTIEFSVNHYCLLCSTATMSTVILTFFTCPKYISTLTNTMPDHTLLKRPENFSFLGQNLFLFIVAIFSVSPLQI